MPNKIPEQLSPVVRATSKTAYTRNTSINEVGQLGKFQWLTEYREIEFEIMYLENNLLRTRKELKRYVEGDLSDIKLTAESNGAKLEEHIKRIKNEIEYKRGCLDDIKNTVRRFNQIDHIILYAKYIEGKSFDEIADETGYSKGTIYNKHASLMKTIRYIDGLIV